MPSYELVSFDLCPYVQRSVITLEEKGVPYDITYIDLNDKPDWFLEISPFGKVPVLKVDDDTVLFESAVINEYLDEVTDGERLHPSDPLARAHNRSWIEFGSSLLVDIYYLMVTTEEEEARERAASLHEKLERLEEQLGEGPYFNGESFSLVDAAAAPALQRIAWSEEIAPDLEITEGLPKVQTWTAACLERESVKASTVSDIFERFVAYLKGGGSPTRDTDPSWLGTRA